MPTTITRHETALTAIRLAGRVAQAIERSGLEPSVIASRSQMHVADLRAASQEGTLTTLQLERIAEATGQSIEFFMAAADEEPVATLLRAEDADRAATRAAIDWFERFVQRYEFLASMHGE